MRINIKKHLDRIIEFSKIESFYSRILWLESSLSLLINSSFFLITGHLKV